MKKKQGFTLAKGGFFGIARKGFTLAEGRFCVVRSERRRAEARQCANRLTIGAASKIQDKAFTLAEVLITLAIIGVVAALTIPSVIANTQQQEFKTGLKKAVSVLNSAITMNMAIDGESPYENGDIYKYLQRHMNVMKSMVMSPWTSGSNVPNLSFYTTDGMRFEFINATSGKIYLYESDSNVIPRMIYNNSYTTSGGKVSRYSCSGSECGHCGAYGLGSKNTDETVNTPCLVVVDVNGDRKPFPQNASCFLPTCASTNVRKYSDPAGKKLTDSFQILITDKQAIPYGTAAQKAMYESQK